jgi:porin
LAQHLHLHARLTLAALLILLPVAGAQAQEVASEKPVAAPRETLTGDWGGLRTRLKQAASPCAPTMSAKPSLR